MPIYTEEQRVRKAAAQKLWEKNNPMKFAYYTWKSQQKFYDREFDLSFDEFKTLWDGSGMFHLRGNSRGYYNLIRIDFEKPATYDNLEVIPAEVAKSRIAKFYGKK